MRKMMGVFQLFCKTIKAWLRFNNPGMFLKAESDSGGRQGKLADLIDRNIVERSWRYNGPKPDIDTQAGKYSADLVSAFSE